MFETIRAIVFDLDDTLYLQQTYKESGFDAVAQWLESTNNASAPEVLKQLRGILVEYGPSYPYMFNRLVERLELPQHLISNCTGVFLSHEPTLSPFPGVKDLLRYLRTWYSLGLLTDGNATIQQKKVRCLGINDLFDRILYSDSLGFTKPAPELYSYFEREFCLPPKSIVYVGDNPHKDFVEANRRGWLSCRVLTGEFASQQVLKPYAAQLAMHDIREILKILGTRTTTFSK